MLAIRFERKSAVVPISSRPPFRSEGGQAGEVSWVAIRFPGSAAVGQAAAALAWAGRRFWRWSSCSFSGAQLSMISSSTLASC